MIPMVDLTNMPRELKIYYFAYLHKYHDIKFLLGSIFRYFVQSIINKFCKPNHRPMQV